jgi:hypothetical protein
MEVFGAMEVGSGRANTLTSSKEVRKMLELDSPHGPRSMFLRPDEIDATLRAAATGAQLPNPSPPTAPKEMATGSSLTWKRKSVQLAGPKDEVDDGDFVRKKLKLSDLPVAATQRSTIDALLLTFKKSGEFDKLRKALFAQFENSVCYCYITLFSKETAVLKIELGCKDHHDPIARRTY